MQPNIVWGPTYEALLSRNSRHFPMAGPIFLPAYKNAVEHFELDILQDGGDELC